jgi:hypothetical protein
MGRKPVVIFTIWCFTTICFAPAKAEEDAQIRELFRKSGVEAAIYDLPGNLRANGAEARKNGQKDDRFDKAFDDAARTAYNSPAIHQRMVETFRGALTPAELKMATRRYNTPLGRRITRLETISAQASASEKIAYVRQAMGDRERLTVRIALCRKLDDATRTTELGVAVSIHTLMALQSAMIKAGMIHDDIGEGELRSKIEKHRSVLHRQAEQGNLISFLFAYRELSADELALHLQFLQSRTGRKLVLAFSAAFDAVLTERAVVFGDELAKNLKTLPL